MRVSIVVRDGSVPDVDEHGGDTDSGNEHLHVAVHGVLHALFLVHLFEGPIPVATDGILAHEDAEDGHGDYSVVGIRREKAGVEGIRTDLDYETAEDYVAALWVKSQQQGE